MLSNQPVRRLMILTWFLTLAAAGCSSDERLVELSRESANRQAEQNHEMARQNQEIAEATHELVEADAKARQEVIELQSSLQDEVRTDRAGLDRQHEELERERRTLAQDRHRDPIIAASIVNAAMLIACVAPIVLCWFVLRHLRQEPAEIAVGELLVHELVADEPLVLPLSFRTPPAIEHKTFQPATVESPASSALNN